MISNFVIPAHPHPTRGPPLPEKNSGIVKYNGVVFGFKQSLKLISNGFNRKYFNFFCLEIILKRVWTFAIQISLNQ